MCSVRVGEGGMCEVTDRMVFFGEGEGWRGLWGGEGRGVWGGLMEGRG